MSRADSLLTSSARAFGPRRPGSTLSAPRSANRFCTDPSLPFVQSVRKLLDQYLRRSAWHKYRVKRGQALLVGSGTSGSIGLRSLAAIASALTLPARTWPNVPSTGSHS